MTAVYTIPRHEPVAPTVADFRATVERVGVDAAVWAGLCAEAGVPAAGSLTIAQLGSLADTIKDRPGVLGVMGRSLAVRVSTYRTLSTLNGVSR
ncbi:MAG TPA: hypothetical protein VD834_02170 [Blastococcus sp.]|jgi:hypothetical protein|nr:hypothetical protein [Blastococcus sp.]